MSYLNKPKAWKKVLNALGESLDFGTLASLQTHTYLDRLEDGVAMVGCTTWNWVETFQRKGLNAKLERVLKERFDTVARVRFTLGAPRIIVKPQRLGQNVCRDCQNSLEDCTCKYGPREKIVKTGIFATQSELEELHATYGDIMGIVDRHPIFAQAQKPLDKGGWGIFERVLTRACKKYGVMAILTALREIATDPTVTQPRAYFDRELKRGRWGHPLVMTPALTGPVLEAV